MNVTGHQRLLLLFAGAALTLGIAACGGSSSSDDDETPAATATSPSGNGDGNGASSDTIEISMIDNSFVPADITVPVGETVTIVARNDGTAIHNMAVNDTEFKSEPMVMAGEESTFEVTFNSAGTYDFQCDFHVPDMVGTITAE
jgi:plastocyanin